MKVLIVEDVTLVADRIAELAKMHMKDCVIKIAHSLESAKLCIQEDIYDLMLLDLNLNGKDGFELLKTVISEAFHTIIITANREQAVRAFDFGVVDFISKPISERRFKIAIDRFLNNSNACKENLRYVSVKSKGTVRLIAFEDIVYIKASGNYSEIYSSKNDFVLHDKNLDKLFKALPDSFVRVHRSYIVPKAKMNQIIKHGGGKYSIRLSGSVTVPLSRSIYKDVFKAE